MVNDTAITVPTAAYRAGNFAGAITGGSVGTDPLGSAIRAGMIYDPLTEQIVNGQPVRDSVPGQHHSGDPHRQSCARRFRP